MLTIKITLCHRRSSAGCARRHPDQAIRLWCALTFGGCLKECIVRHSHATSMGKRDVAGGGGTGCSHAAHPDNDTLVRFCSIAEELGVHAHLEACW
jgi:hypothetical protein